MARCQWPEVGGQRSLSCPVLLHFLLAFFFVRESSDQLAYSSDLLPPPNPKTTARVAYIDT